MPLLQAQRALGPQVPQEEAQPSRTPGASLGDRGSSPDACHGGGEPGSITVHGTISGEHVDTSGIHNPRPPEGEQAVRATQGQRRTGSRSAFSELDTGIQGTVKFGDGSVVNIQGRGIVLFKCKNGEHQALTGVYHIPRLTANIMSLGQLDAEGFKILIEDGVLRVWDLARRLLVRVRRTTNNLYTLSLDIGWPVCLAA